MAMVRKTVIGEILPPEMGGGIVSPDAVFYETGEEQEQEDEAIESAIAELGTSGSDAKINVYLLEPGKGSAYVGAYDPSNFSIEDIQRTYGPGEYKIHVRRGKTILKNKIIKIAAPKIPLVSAGLPNQSIEKLAETMNAGFNGLTQMITQTVQAIAANHQPQKTTEEMLREMQLMKEILGPSNNAPHNDSNTLDMFLRGVEFAKELAPRDSEVTTNELILEGVKHFGGAFAAMKQIQANGAIPHGAMPQAPINNTPRNLAQQTQAPQIPINTQTPSPNVVIEKPLADTPGPLLSQNSGAISSTESQEGNTMQANLEPLLQQSVEQIDMMKTIAMQTLLANAKAGNDPETYANLALDMMGDEYCIAFASAPDWFEKLCAQIPDAAPYRAWFEEMRDCILELTDLKANANTNNIDVPPTVASQGPTLGDSATVPDSTGATDAVQQERSTDNKSGEQPPA
jgi:hypothetical protein